MTSPVDFKISVRAHSDSVSFKPLTQRLGARASTVYDKGDLTHSGRMYGTGRKSADNYFTTKDIELAGVADLNRTIREQLALIDNEPTLSALTRASDGHVVVWVAVFGKQPRKTDTLGIDLRPFGHGIGLVVDNFTIPAESGSEVFEIKPHGVSQAS
ncbi:MAG TPA: hypothetical protein VHB74_16505 [Devosia sp.]|nr:hypothetical protein [Devosia sp.]